MGQFDISFHTGPDSPGYKIAFLILSILAFKILIILIAHYSERFLIKKFLHRLKQLLKKGDETDVESLKEKTIPREDNSGFIERLFYNQDYRFYLYLKEEFIALIGKASNESDKYSPSLDFQFFSARIKRKLSAKLDKIKFGVHFSLAAVLLSFIAAVNAIMLAGLSDDRVVFFLRLAFIQIAEVLASTGTILVIVLFLSLIGHFSIKKKFNLIMDETSDLIDMVCKNKTKEK